MKHIINIDNNYWIFILTILLLSVRCRRTPIWLIFGNHAFAFPVCKVPRNYQSNEYVLLFVDLVLFLLSDAFSLNVFPFLQVYVDVINKHISFLSFQTMKEY